MIEPLPLVLVGCGGIAHAYLQALPAVPGLRLVAAVDPVPERVAAVAASTGCQPFADVDRMLAQFRPGRDLHAALVLSPPDQHEALATRLLTSGLDVLCEKPLCTTTAAAERMLATARAGGRLLMMGSKFRYTEDVRLGRELLEHRLLGDVLLLENVFCSRVDMTKRWNAVPAIAGGGVLIDNGSHSVDLARHLLGPIERVFAWFGRQSQPLPVEDTAHLLFECNSGAKGTIVLSWSMHQEDPAYVRVFGTRGVLEIGWRQSRYKLADGDWQPFGHGYDKVRAFAAQLANFAGCVRGEQAPVIGDADALASVRVIERAYQSAAEGRFVAVD